MSQIRSQIGTVISRKMEKTAIVRVQRRKAELHFKKIEVHSKKYKVHDEKNECRPGDQVLIVQTRPLSREKKWRVVKILGRGLGVENAEI